MVSPTLQSTLKDGFGEAIVPCDVPKPWFGLDMVWVSGIYWQNIHATHQSISTPSKQSMHQAINILKCAFNITEELPTFVCFLFNNIHCPMILKRKQRQLSPSHDTSSLSYDYEMQTLSNYLWYKPRKQQNQKCLNRKQKHSHTPQIAVWKRNQI